MVLVEGEEDRAALLGSAFLKEPPLDPESRGIAIIPANSKNNLDRLYIIFSGLGIPIYLVWDSDHGKKDAKPEYNRALLRLVSEAPEDWPEKITPTFACFKKDLMTTLRSELGPQNYEKYLAQCQEEFGYKEGRDCSKNPQVMETLLRKAKDEGHSSSSLASIVEHVVNLLDTA
ncbi:MAG TPA: ATP-dependent endonuclease [Dehalococcoidia bacterium]|nr:ATP-dependent endonuclease [Dehalococcoidia bacterium]